MSIHKSTHHNLNQGSMLLPPLLMYQLSDKVTASPQNPSINLFKQYQSHKLQNPQTQQSHALV